MLPHNKLFSKTKTLTTAQILTEEDDILSQSTEKWIQFSRCTETHLRLIYKSSTSSHQQINDIHVLIYFPGHLFVISSTLKGLINLLVFVLGIETRTSYMLSSCCTNEPQPLKDFFLISRLLQKFYTQVYFQELIFITFQN
jgi:hypothetical protein